MSFVGIISDNKRFKNIKTKISKNKTNIEIIKIRLNSIENIKNVKFDIIVIDYDLEKSNLNKAILEKICANAKYILVNTDLYNDTNLEKYKEKIITYGLNQQATVTISSVSEQYTLIFVQKSVKNIQNKNIEISENRIDLKENDILNTYEILVIYIILAIYNIKIIDVI